MQSYIKIKGNEQIEPLIQYARPLINETGDLELEIIILMQCDNYILHVEKQHIKGMF